MADKVALITGAGSGVGKAAALALAKAGFAIVLAGRRPGSARAVARKIDRHSAARRSRCRPTSAIRIRSPRSSPRRRPRSAASTCSSTTPASGAPGVPLEELTFEQWQAVVAANLTGAFLCTQQAFRLMKAQNPRGGRIINNGSISAHAPRPNSAPYTATKHAITGLTKSTALDGRAFDIACGQIDIGNAATEMTATHDRGRAPGERHDRRRAAHGRRRTSPTRSSTWRACRSTSNVLFMTVMATKMPFVGRG